MQRELSRDLKQQVRKGLSSRLRSAPWGLIDLMIVVV
jgi:hypothetical protein